MGAFFVGPAILVFGQYQHYGKICIQQQFDVKYKMMDEHFTTIEVRIVLCGTLTLDISLLVIFFLGLFVVLLFFL